jgi:hypothetical protein
MIDGTVKVDSQWAKVVDVKRDLSWGSITHPSDVFSKKIDYRWALSGCWAYGAYNYRINREKILVHK